MKNEIKVIRVHESTRHNPEILTIKNDLDDFYKAIDADCIDMPSILGMGYCLICDDTGLIDRRPLTLCIDGYRIYGTCLITKVNQGGETVSLTDFDILFLLSMIK